MVARRPGCLTVCCPSPPLTFVTVCMILCFGNEQVLSQLPKNAPRAFSFEKNHEMHEFRPHEDMSFTSGDEGLSSVMWHDIVQVNDY